MTLYVPSTVRDYKLAAKHIEFQETLQFSNGKITKSRLCISCSLICALTEICPGIWSKVIREKSWRTSRVNQLKTRGGDNISDRKSCVCKGWDVRENSKHIENCKGPRGLGREPEGGKTVVRGRLESVAGRVQLYSENYFFKSEFL